MFPYSWNIHVFMYFPHYVSLKIHAVQTLHDLEQTLFAYFIIFFYLEENKG